MPFYPVTTRTYNKFFATDFVKNENNTIQWLDSSQYIVPQLCRTLIDFIKFFFHDKTLKIKVGQKNLKNLILLSHPTNQLKVGG